MTAVSSSTAQSTVRGHLPIRPDLLKYVYFKENLPEGAPLELPGLGVVRGELHNLIAFGHGVYSPFTLERPEETLAPLCARLPFVLHTATYHDFFEYADHVAYHFSRFLQRLRMDDLTLRYMVAQELGVAGKDYIDSIVSSLDFQEQKEFDAIIKGSYRLRTQRAQVVCKPRHATAKSIVAAPLEGLFALAS